MWGGSSSRQPLWRHHSINSSSPLRVGRSRVPVLRSSRRRSRRLDTGERLLSQANSGSARSPSTRHTSVIGGEQEAVELTGSRSSSTHGTVFAMPQGLADPRRGSREWTARRSGYVSGSENRTNRLPGALLASRRRGRRVRPQAMPTRNAVRFRGGPATVTGERALGARAAVDHTCPTRNAVTERAKR